MIKRCFLAMTLTIAVSAGCYSQSNNIDSIKAQLKNLNNFFDSAQFLAFNVDIQYTTDTVFGKFNSDRELANYVINGKNLYYRIGEMEYMQNNSLSVTAYNSEQTLIVAKQSIKQASTLFPLKEFSDSALNYFFTSYNVTIGDIDDVRIIRFKSDSLNVPFKEVALYYEPSHFIISKIEMTFLQAPNSEDLPDSNIIAPALINKHLTMEFSGYKFIENTDMFKDDQYIYFDRRRKEYTAAGKYKGYRLVANNLENTGKDYDDIEVPATADNNQQ